MTDDTKKQASDGVQFSVERIYLKESSFESPNSPASFRNKWKPDVKVNFQSKVTKIDEGFHDVVLTLTATAENSEQVAFHAEVQQAGVFQVQHADDEQLEPLLNAYCPHLLYPYATQKIAQMVVEGGFPPLYLPPVNFDAVYAESKENKEKKASSAE